MSRSEDMSVKPGPDPVRRPNARRLRRATRAFLPVVVWLSAIAATLHLYRSIAGPGTIEGYAVDEAVRLACFESGIIRDVHVRVYDPVVRGQLLMSLDDRRERIQLAAIEKDIERMHAEVVAEKTRLGADNTRATADVTDLARRFAVDRAMAHVEYLSQLVVEARDRALLHGASVELELVHGLHAEGNAPRRELNVAETEAEALRAGVTGNKEVLQRRKKAFEEADQRWAEFVARPEVMTPYEPVLTPLRLAIEVRQRDLEETVRQIDARVLRAPIDGQVTDLLAHVGDQVEAGSLLVTVSPQFTNRVMSYLPESMALSARVGTAVRVNCLAAAGRNRREYAGTVVGLSAAVGEAPLRYRQIPNYPVWGRGLVVALGEDIRLIPGEAAMIALAPER